MDELLDEYRAKFKEAFPLMLCRGLTDEKVCQIVQQCLDDGKRYEPELDPDADY